MTSKLPKDLRLGRGTIFGRLGYGWTKPVILSVLDRARGYAVAQGYSTFVLGFDGGEVTEDVFNSLVVDFFEESGGEVFMPNTVVTQPQFAWFIKELNKKALGIYIGNDSSPFGSFGITFIGPEGEYLSAGSLEQLLGSKAAPHSEYQSDYFNLSTYVSFLKDKARVPYQSLRGQPIGLDLMFGSAEALLEPGNKELAWKITSFNSQKQATRIRGYLSNPTGNNLAWTARSEQAAGCKYFIAFNHTGTKIGFWDCKQRLEISPGGIMLILLLYFSRMAEKAEGKVFVTPAVSDRVMTVAKALNIPCEVIPDSYESLLERRSEMLAFCDHRGTFFTNKDHIVENPLELLTMVLHTCHVLDKSPGEVVDELCSKYLSKAHFHSLVFFDDSQFPEKEIAARVSRLPEIAECKYDKKLKVFRSKKPEFKIAVASNPLTTWIDVTIEAHSEQVTKDLASVIQKAVL